MTKNVWTRYRQEGYALVHPKHISGRYYQTSLGVGALTTTALAANTLYATPIFIPALNTYTGIALEITVASAGNFRFGIYNDGGGVPTSLVVDAGTLAHTLTGSKESAISQALPPGWYWLALVASTTPTVRTVAVAPSLPWLGYTSGTDPASGGTSRNYVGWSVAFTYAALPNPFTAGGALMTTAVARLMLKF